VTSYYSPAHDLGIAWNDPDLAVEWPVAAEQVVLSDKDTRLPGFASLPAYFE
jgi:dTDP-4-dehydrorhamnose 3,5-epimerase